MRRKAIIVVVGLLALLVLYVLLFPSVGSGPGGPRAYAIVDATTIAIAAKNYQVEYGSFPTGSLVQIAAALLGQNSNRIVFIEMPQKSIGTDGRFIDPWGQAYILTFAGATSVVVTSAGKDKVFGTADDIKVERVGHRGSP